MGADRRRFRWPGLRLFRSGVKGVALLVLGGCARPSAAPEIQSSRIVAVTIARETPRELELEVTYEHVAGLPPGRIWGIPLFEGRSTGYWAYHSAEILPGRHTARERIGINEAEAPDFYLSDAVEVRLGSAAAAPFVLSHEKFWCKRPSGCERAELDALERGPLAERVSSDQPSIRDRAAKEASKLALPSKRELLPTMLSVLRGSDRNRRHQVLWVLGEWRLAEPDVLRALEACVGDADPAVERLAVSALSTSAPHDDARTRAVMERAATSTDETTREAAKAWLDPAPTEGAHPLAEH